MANRFMPAESPNNATTSHSKTQRQHAFHSPPHRHRHGILPRTSSLPVIIPMISALLLVLIAIVVFMARRLKSVRGKETSKSSSKINEFKMVANTTTINLGESPDIKSTCLNGGSSRRMPQRKLRGVVQVFTYKELELATDSFSEANVIGRGGFAIVYRGVLSDGTVAAVKMMHREGKQGERAFRVEVDLLSHLNSPYLVQLLGYCADQKHRLLVFEFMPNGSLQQHLHSPHIFPRPLDWGTRLRIALDCARALEYLHEHTSPSIIHHDFKCSNILLDENFRAKVSDFGLAMACSDKINGQFSTCVLGTTGYLAPEYVLTGKLTTKSDVYSYGVVLLQLITGQIPIDTRRTQGEDVLVSWAFPRLTDRESVIQMVDQALKGHYSKKDLIQVAAIAAVCVQAEADYRPLMTDVVQSLIPLVKNHKSLSSSSARFPSHVSIPSY